MKKTFKKTILEDSTYRLKTDIMSVSLKLLLAPDAHVPDLLTRIRILEGVAVVGQKDKVVRALTGKDTLFIYVKFLPSPGTKIQAIKKIAKDIKLLPGVEIVKVITLDDRRVTYMGNPIII